LFLYYRGGRKVPNVIVDKKDKSDDEDNDDDNENDFLNKDYDSQARTDSGFRRQEANGDGDADENHGSFYESILPL
jgi:hypothetical protein